MKKFIWPLQRLLEVKQRREEALTLELASADRRIDELTRQIQRRQAILQAAAASLAAEALPQRLPRQQVFVAQAEVGEREIRRLTDARKAEQERRATLLRDLLSLRQARQSLERLREEALARHMQEQGRVEQAALDERSSTRFTARARDASGGR